MVLFTVDHSNHLKKNKVFNVPFPHLAKCSKLGVLLTVLPFICCLGPFTRALSWFQLASTFSPQVGPVVQNVK